MFHSLRFASPWWVNLLILAPLASYFLFKGGKVHIGKKRLFLTALFGIAFGFVEAAVVVYLRAATGLWPHPPTEVLAAVPTVLFRIEFCREAATMIMLGSFALILGQNAREKMVAFLWTFAFWDFFYYVWLRLTIGWPGSVIDPDVLFLIPVPWLAQVWFPLLVSGLTIIVIWICSYRFKLK